MEADRRRRSRVRNPLSDCTNTLNSSHSSSSSSSSSTILRKSRKSILSSAINRLLTDADAKFAARNDGVGGNAATLPPPVDSTPSRPQRPFSALGKGEGTEPCSVYTRRQGAEKMKSIVKPTEELLSGSLTAEKMKSKGKAIDEPLSCFPATKIQKIGCHHRENIKDDGGQRVPKACTALRKKKQGHGPSKKDSDKLSQDYIEQQRAYFAEIDAFELPEEEVESVSELD